MAYYCGECIVWRGSRDENRYGERWCSYSRRYERSDQNTYGCKGFVYAGRAVLTKVCEILELDKEPWFDAFDRVKEAYLVPQEMTLLVDYCGMGPKVAEQLEHDADRESVAQQIVKEYLLPARTMSNEGHYRQAVQIYARMVTELREKYKI